ncbi:MAG: HlyD family secretion protein [Mariniblastus sp.]
MPQSPTNPEFMSKASEPTAIPVTPGQRAVGFRAPTNKNPKDKNNFGESSGQLGTQVDSKTVAESSKQKTESVRTTSAKSAPPQKKRAKGNGFFAFLFLAAFVTAGYLTWATFLQYQAYGVIGGRVISVGAPWNGNIVQWQVRDGDIVSQGDIVATMSNMEMEHQLAELGDDLKMTQAQLDAEMSKIQFEVRETNQQTQKALAEYLQASGEYLGEKARFRDLDKQLQRARKLLKTQDVSSSKYEKLYYEFVGQKLKTEKLQKAVEVLRIRSEQAGESQQNGSSQLKPLLAKIEITQANMSRLRERINQGQIKAPVSGRVTNRFSLTGESVKQGEPVIEILEDNSIEVVLYVPQRISDEFEAGKDVSVQLEPLKQNLHCSVTRIGDRFEAAPPSISGFYKPRQYLLPVYLKPHPGGEQQLSMRIHGTVKRPYEWHKTIVKSWEKVKRNYFDSPTNAAPINERETVNQLVSDRKNLPRLESN